MFSKKKKLLVLLSLLGAVALLLACAAGEEEATPAAGETSTTAEATATRVVLPTATPTPVGGVEKTQGGVLRLASSAYNPPNWDPITYSYKTHYMLNMVHANLINFHYGAAYSSWDITPSSDGLAESWDISDDGKTYTFHIKKGVKFQDRPPVNGRELTSEDVKWSIEYHAKGFQEWKYDVIDSIDCPDKYTVVFSLEEPRSSFVFMLGDHQGAEILAPETMDLEGDLKQWYTAVGAGPFQVVSVTPDVGQVFQRNPNYYRANEGLPCVDEVKLLVVADSSTTLAAFRAGSLDIRGISRTDFDSVKATNPDIHCYEGELSTSPHNMIWMRTDMAPYNDVRVRQAIAMAIDRQAVIQSQYMGYGEEQLGLIRYAHPAYLKDQGECMKYQQYNPEEAKRLLAEAGYPDGFADTITGTSGYGTTVLEYGELVIDMLSKIGIDLTYKIQDYAAWVATTNVGKQEGMAFGYAPSDTDPDGWLASYLPYDESGGKNRSHVDDPELQEMVHAQKTALTPEERIEILHDIQRYTACQQYYIAWPIAYGISCSQPWCYGYRSHATYISYGRIYEQVWMIDDAPNRKLELSKDTFPYDKFK